MELYEYVSILYKENQFIKNINNDNVNLNDYIFRWLDCFD